MTEKELKEMLHRAARNLAHCCQQINAFRALEDTKLERKFSDKLRNLVSLLENMGMRADFGMESDEGILYYSYAEVSYKGWGYTVFFGTED